MAVAAASAEVSTRRHLDRALAVETGRRHGCGAPWSIRRRTIEEVLLVPRERQSATGRCRSAQSVRAEHSHPRGEREMSEEVVESKAQTSSTPIESVVSARVEPARKRLPLGDSSSFGVQGVEHGVRTAAMAARRG